jgi:hypothetical protein
MALCKLAFESSAQGFGRLDRYASSDELNFQSREREITVVRELRTDPQTITLCANVIPRLSMIAVAHHGAVSTVPTKRLLQAGLRRHATTAALHQTAPHIHIMTAFYCERCISTIPCCAATTAASATAVACAHHRS